MATWTSLVVLSLAVVSTLSFPRPDAEYKIPTVGLGARAQYYVLHSDGTFKYGYDTGDGLFEQSMAQAPSQVSGAFGYKDPTGADIKLEYTADDRGFIATGAHLPVAPAFDAGVASTRAAATKYASSAPAASSTSSIAATRSAAPAPAPAPSAPVEVAQVRSASGDDGSYSFSYDTSSSSRSESGDARNSVRGQYAFVADDGVNRAITYTSNAGEGYIAEGDSIPVGPPVPGAESGRPTGRILPILSEEEANALARATSTSSVKKYSAASSSPFVPSAAASATPSTRTTATGSRDASYSFNYDAGDSSRSESADADLNVQGSFSFVPPEGHRLTVNYVAGSGTGFVATGDHLPVAPEADLHFGVKGAPSPAAATAVTAYSGPSAAATAFPHASAPAFPRASAPSPAPSAPVEVAQVRSASGDDGSYSFAYDSSSSSRSESGDARNSVRGQYAFVADDGVNRAITYTANAKEGYIAEGDSIPVGPPVPGAESGRPTGRILPILSEEEANALAGATSTSSAKKYSAASASPSFVPSAAASAAPSTRTTATGSRDASYSFNYDAGDSSRSESADADLNVKGSFSFVPPEGHTLTVNYIAGSGTGFVATGDHLPVAPDADAGAQVRGSAAASTVTAYAAPTAAASATPSATAAAVSAPAGVAQVRSASGNDGSYSFSYENSDSSRSESADAQNSVTGHYTYVADDGINRRIEYIAGSGTGYIAEGDSLPIGPPVPGAESGIPTGRILPVFSEQEANAIAAGTYSAGGSASPTLKSGAGSATSGTPADASYSFSFASDSYSRNEEADRDGNVKGSYTYVDEDGKEHTVNFVAGRETGFLPEGYPTPAPASAAALASAPVSTAAPFPATSFRAATSPAAGAAVSTKAAGSTSATKFSASQKASSSSGFSSRVIGDVLLHQYDAVNRDKYGYVFTAVRR